MRHFADIVCAERGVRHGHVNLISVEEDAPRPKGNSSAGLKQIGRLHSHGIGGKPHTHLKPAT